LATPAPAATATVPFGSVSSASATSVVDAGVPRSGYETADRIVVKKSERRLYLLRANQAIAEYPIRLGLNPNGHKLREGDFRTPEGTYELVRRNPRSDYFMSIEVSYPNDADRARAKQLGVKPGGLIMIHGMPNVLRKSPENYANFDWTNGCIAVSNSDMVDIWLRTGLGTPVEIRP
jgi:murein L,D-transpeptidase YafK